MTPNSPPQSLIHLRNPLVPTRAHCGMGYTWPSSIALTNITTDVTCRSCQYEPLLLNKVNTLTLRQLSIRLVLSAFEAYEESTDAGADPYDVLFNLGVTRHIRSSGREAGERGVSHSGGGRSVR